METQLWLLNLILNSLVDIPQSSLTKPEVHIA